MFGTSGVDEDLTGLWGYIRQKKQKKHSCKTKRTKAGHQKIRLKFVMSTRPYIQSAAREDELWEEVRLKMKRNL